MGNEKRDLIFLVEFALALRILLYKWTYLIAIDGTGFYLKPAQHFASGQWMDGLAVGYHPLFFLLFMVGLVRRKVPPRWANGEGFLLSVVGLYALVMYWLATLSYISHRYLISFVALCFIWSGRGLLELHHWLLQRVSREKWRKMTIRPERGLVILTMIFLVIVLPMGIRPQRPENGFYLSGILHITETRGPARGLQNGQGR